MKLNTDYIRKAYHKSRDAPSFFMPAAGKITIFAKGGIPKSGKMNISSLITNCGYQ